MSRHADPWDRQRRADQRGAVVAVVLLLALITATTWAAFRVVL
ncbi:hypothetical protein [Haloechinothrix salitolerans]|uniref:Uncharacterized protein n=1 Tax=Haloechinothrix salitolerans TaxID=926830 RepID=A0ABW2C6L7_9PSEU